MKYRLLFFLTALLAFSGGVTVDRLYINAKIEGEITEDPAPSDPDAPLRATSANSPASLKTAALTQIASKNGNSHRLYREVASLSLDELSLLARKIVRSTEPATLKQRGKIVKAMIHRWTELDPAGAWRFVLEPWHGDKKDSGKDRGVEWVDTIFVSFTLVFKQI